MTPSVAGLVSTGALWTCGPQIPDRIGIWKCWFLRRGENRRTRRKTSRSKDENQQQTQPTFDAESGNRTRATLVGGLRGRQMLNHCAIPAPLLGADPKWLTQCCDFWSFWLGNYWFDQPSTEGKAIQSSQMCCS